MANVEPPTPPTADLSPRPGPEPNKDERTLAMLCHLLALCGYVVPFGNIIGPLVLWMMKKDELPLVDDQGKESLNFQITMTIVAVVCALTLCIGVGVVLLPIVAVVEIVFIIIAAMKANGGEAYRYPFCLRLIK
jgi:uncharacterized protein